MDDAQGQSYIEIQRVKSLYALLIRNNQLQEELKATNDVSATRKIY